MMNCLNISKRSVGVRATPSRCGITFILFAFQRRTGTKRSFKIFAAKSKCPEQSLLFPTSTPSKMARTTKTRCPIPQSDRAGPQRRTVMADLMFAHLALENLATFPSLLWVYLVLLCFIPAATVSDILSSILSVFHCYTISPSDVILMCYATLSVLASLTATSPLAGSRSDLCYSSRSCALVLGDNFGASKVGQMQAKHRANLDNWYARLRRGANQDHRILRGLIGNSLNKLPRGSMNKASASLCVSVTWRRKTFVLRKV
ncbi:hypothetical protein B0H63DRAFT_232848 [Podospora didyma]|uniref:Uncharacterized protein n=1 Tax=Podospora didyma TaxID=330526 RepID=A0AAE0NBK3_9PEZI|nr:hypothetical protein B0H63DRAFT_232848 [Podospora didyma]